MTIRKGHGPTIEKADSTNASHLGFEASAFFLLQLGVLFREGVGDVFEEDEAEDDVFVFGGVEVLIQSRSFSEMLEASVRKYQNRAIETAAVIEELIAFPSPHCHRQRRSADSRFTFSNGLALR
jgi:hypothetical protein